MPRNSLSPDELEEFRNALCASATRLFAAHGYEGVTMRALARDLGCSPMTPYRYFANKAEIFETVRSAAATRFAEAIDRAAKAHTDHKDRLRAMCHAYVGFALDEPHGYRIIFELDADQRPEPNRAENARGYFVMRDAVAEAIEQGELTGEPEVVSHLLWSGVHGLVALHLAGMLALGQELETLVEAFLDRELAAPPLADGRSRASERTN